MSRGFDGGIGMGAESAMSQVTGALSEILKNQNSASSGGGGGGGGGGGDGGGGGGSGGGLGDLFNPQKMKDFFDKAMPNIYG
jgi:hypothetical protein